MCSVFTLRKPPQFPTKNIDTHQLTHEAESSKPQPQEFFFFLNIWVTDLENLWKFKTEQNNQKYI